MISVPNEMTILT